jgi:hypothetical protein
VVDLGGHLGVAAAFRNQKEYLGLRRVATKAPEELLMVEQLLSSALRAAGSVGATRAAAGADATSEEAAGMGNGLGLISCAAVGMCRWRGRSSTIAGIVAALASRNAHATTHVALVSYSTCG